MQYDQASVPEGKRLALYAIQRNPQLSGKQNCELNLSIGLTLATQVDAPKGVCGTLPRILFLAQLLAFGFRQSQRQHGR